MAQKGSHLKFTLYEKAKIDVAGIPEFVAAHKDSLRFVADAKAPYFICELNKNTREKKADTKDILEAFLSEAAEILLPGNTDTK